MIHPSPAKIQISVSKWKIVLCKKPNIPKRPKMNKLVIALELDWFAFENG